MLPSSVVVTKAGRRLPLLLAAILFAGCTGTGTRTSPVDIQGAASRSSDYYLQQLQQSADDNKADWQLLAIRALLNEGKTDAAKAQLDALPGQLNAPQSRERDLLVAQLLLAQNAARQAQAQLKEIDVALLSDAQKARYYQLQITALQGQPSLALLRALIAQEPLLTGEAHQKNIDTTWQTLTQLTPAQLQSLVINADENTLQGWLDLLNVYSTQRSDADRLKTAISDWQTRYPQNPGAKTLPSALDQLQNMQPASTGRIALLLPLNGQAQNFGKAIQQGFNDAKNGLLSAPETTPASESAPASEADAVVSPSAEATPAAAPAPAPTPAASSAEIRVYDSSAQPIDQLLAQAQRDGATLVVGPLLKNQVDGVAASQTPLNVLALNTPAHMQNHPNLCYFALSPEDEARDAAQHMWDQGKRSPLLLLPRNDLGDRVASAFAGKWSELGGSTVLQQRFGSTGELKQNINSGAGISLSGTPVAAPPPQSIAIAGLSIPAPQSEPTASSTGGGLDSAYIVATQSELALIKPMITMRAGSRSNVALYASSRSAQAGAGPDFRLEMEGIQYSDIPLLSGGNPALMQQVAGQFNHDYSLVRLYAMGADAWQLASHFSEVRQLPGYQLKGETGTLTTDQNCMINRKLSWNQYQQGQIVPVN
ncbi:penicillin-binding protein activator [Pantoea sp. 1.19]|uniref:penicillin-binding protein activator n=1 Tax=Pantoea sp. 1.19 TaxID=1925589 RepID=UPI000948F6DC|nr:penicillin-binding protein activator [Pantoea sp. 1.19]